MHSLKQYLGSTVGDTQTAVAIITDENDEAPSIAKQERKK